MSGDLIGGKENMRIEAYGSSATGTFISYPNPRLSLY